MDLIGYIVILIMGIKHNLLVSSYYKVRKQLLHFSRLIEFKVNRTLAPKKVKSVKLVAVAKNESAYLLEWIFHHLYMGFSEIDIYYNGCSDNTLDLIPLLKDFPVNFINADDTFDASTTTPQVDIYRQCFRLRENRKFDALMFLDIDEFWVPNNFEDKISDVCNRVGEFESVSFQWKNKLERNNPFAPALEKTINVEAAKQIKTLYRAYLKPTRMNPHNVLDNELNQKYEDGKTLETVNDQHSQCQLSDSSTNAFILHRKDRSEFEYIAMLLRGRPINTRASQEEFALKGNRHGFKLSYDSKTLTFNSAAFLHYRNYMETILNSSAFNSFQKDAKLQVDMRYSLVLEVISKASERDTVLLDKLLTNITLPDVNHVYPK
ncbi:glycosyltransferase family 2 protein [Alteromonas sp. 1_MG-2023]|uniref:glycosyltransferase family 2 protein n=1 Tax=Alteromonas sp. 1_MG-2023 TaxID=3062669 RepID=UPI0026E405C7|nr:glycosyltransferase family 2 protein [Alteromonas sp. 1_MG-2023]MDO6569271.1 glycosyltransferase family 2 protein [Alteromonas sp. 1_MG-2023]